MTSPEQIEWQRWFAEVLCRPTREEIVAEAIKGLCDDVHQILEVEP